MPRGREPEDHTGKTYKHWLVQKRAAPQVPSIPGVAVPWICECMVCGHHQRVIPLQFKYPYKGVARCVGCAQIKKESVAA